MLLTEVKEIDFSGNISQTLDYTFKELFQKLDQQFY
jgi:hypothetical protein